MNKVVALTQRPLEERGWGKGEIAKDVLTWCKGDVWFKEEIAAQANQALADQPLLHEEISRLETECAALAEAVRYYEADKLAAHAKSREDSELQAHIDKGVAIFYEEREKANIKATRAEARNAVLKEIEKRFLGFCSELATVGGSDEQRQGWKDGTSTIIRAFQATIRALQSSSADIPSVPSPVTHKNNADNRPE